MIEEDEIPEDTKRRAFAEMKCPRCGDSAASMRSGSISSQTLEWQNACYWRGEYETGFSCKHRRKTDAERERDAIGRRNYIREIAARQAKEYSDYIREERQRRQ